MYTIISGTNRPESHSEKTAKIYKHLLKEKNIDAGLLSLENVDLFHRSADIIKMEKDILFPTHKFIFVVPEYNGSYPGVLKTLIDHTDRKAWQFKKALLTGVATGRAGNLRGMDHLADTLQYLKMNVHYNKLPISLIDKVIDEKGNFDAETIRVIKAQLNEFIEY